MQSVNTFLAYLTSEKRYSILTVRAYTKDLEQFFLFVQDHYGSMDNESCIKHQHLRAWLANLNSNEQSAKTINRKISTLKSYFKYLLKQGIIQDTPTDKIISPKVQKRLPSFMQEAEVENMLENKANFSTDFKGKTDRLIIELLYTSGMRRSELANLRTQDFNFYNKSIKVIGKGNKERIIPMLDTIAQLVQDYIQEKEAIENADATVLLVLPNGKALYHKYIYLVAKKHIQNNTTLQKNSPHILRHTFATHMLNAGAELNAIKELLGHTSLAATQVYTHNSIEKLKKAYKQAHPKA